MSFLRSTAEKKQHLSRCLNNGSSCRYKARVSQPEARQLCTGLRNIQRSDLNIQRCARLSRYLHDLKLVIHRSPAKLPPQFGVFLQQRTQSARAILTIFYFEGIQSFSAGNLRVQLVRQQLFNVPVSCLVFRKKAV
jgi:hypothetical protein